MQLFCHSMGTFVCAAALKQRALAARVDTVVMYAPVFGATRSSPPRGVHESIGDAKTAGSLMAALRASDAKVTYVVATGDRLFDDPDAGVPAFAAQVMRVRASHMAAAWNSRVVRGILRQLP